MDMQSSVAKDSKRLKICLFYRSPNSSELNTEKLADLFERFNDFDLIIGDLNLPKIDWINNLSDSKGMPILEKIRSVGLVQLIDFATHLAGSTLDVAFSPEIHNISTITNVGNIGTSDHSGILIGMSCDFYNDVEMKVVQDWKRANRAGLSEYLTSIHWRDELEVKDPWEVFKSLLQVGLDKFVPMRTHTSRANPLWFTKETKRISEAKRRHFKKYLCTRTTQDFKQYKTTEKKCKKIILRAKRNFERRIASADDRKLFANYVKSKSKNKESIGPLKKGPNLTNDPKDMCNILNDYFASVFTVDNTILNEEYAMKNKGCEIHNICINRDKVIKVISDLKPNTSKDPNGFTNRLLKDFKSELAEPLSIIFKHCLKNGYVPKDWKIANVCPIFKKGQKSEPSNYRPVSLTSVVCKVFERLLQKSIMDHLEKNNILNETQHGFRSRKSCTTNLIDFLNYATEKLDGGEPVDIIYYDFAKAFDKVPISKLLIKVKSYGIKGEIFNWIAEWLKNRKQRTLLIDSYSDWKDVLSGVPQGSVLGPLLFIIFIDDIDDCTRDIDKASKFADDTKTANRVTSANDHTNLQNCIDEMFKWSQKWSMEFNVKKCKVMHIGHNNPCLNYVMNGTNLENVLSEKDIGVTITKNLKPSEHCVKASVTAMSVLFQLLRTFHFRDKKNLCRTLQNLCKAAPRVCGPSVEPMDGKGSGITGKGTEKVCPKYQWPKGENI